MPTRHEGGGGQAFRLGEQDDCQDRADQGEGSADAEGRGVALVEGAVDRAGGERDHQLNMRSNTGSVNFLL